MKVFGKLFLAAFCLQSLATFGFSAGIKKVSAKEGIVVVEAEAQMFSDGYKVSSINLLYRKKLDPSSVSVDDYEVVGMTVKSVSVDGKNVKLTMDTDNRWYPERDDVAPFDADRQFSRYVNVTQNGEVSAVGGGTVYTGPATVTSKKIAEPKIVKEFMEKSYRDDETGAEIHYSVYMPLYYTEGWNYPAIIFIPDSRANTNISKCTILQGEGAAVWATASEQEKQKSIIVAIQYPKYTEDKYGPLVKPDGSWTTALGVVYRAIRTELSSLRVDRSRIYAVGQGEGAVANFQIGQKYPEFYAAQLAISPMYEIKAPSALENEKLWILTSSNDSQSCDAMDKAVSFWKDDGIRIDRGSWNVDYSEQAFATAAKDMAGKKGRVKYTVVEGGCREYVWCIAPRIEVIRDWLMAQ
ncbi:MAG: hypothetical protein K6G18_15485 [Treponema sp.]|nr:hypothetical protein [Treponema sp.]MCR5623243.1 hypothetical protein [Treponema sp.]